MTLGAAINVLVATPKPYTLTNKTIDVGQISIANTVISNRAAGTTSYWQLVLLSLPLIKYRWSNTPNALLPTSNNALTITINALASNSLKLTFNGIVYYANAMGVNTIYGTWTFNAFATDANGDLSPDPPTNTITINPQLLANEITPQAPSIDTGQSLTLTSNAVGGTTAYSYKWYTNIAGNPACNAANVITGQTGSTISVSPTTSNSYTYQVTDSASTNEVVCSAADTVTVSASALSAGAVTPSLPSIDNGQSITLTSTHQEERHLTLKLVLHHSGIKQRNHLRNCRLDIRGNDNEHLHTIPDLEHILLLHIG